MINPKARPCEEGVILSARGTVDCAARAKPWVLVATILGSAMAFTDGSVVNVALPAIEKDLDTSVVVIQWVINAYELCLAALLLAGGAAGDRFGRRRVFVIGIGIFAAASIWCGFSPSVVQLILARAAQGLGAALMIPGSLAIIGASFDEAERGKAIGTWAGFTAIAAAIGPLLGGWIVDNSNWRVIFLINPFIALPTIWVALRHVPESRDPQAISGLDWRGTLLALGGLGGLVFGLIASSDRGWRDPVVLGSVVIGTVLLVAFVLTERRARAPMMPPDLFRSRTFSGINLLTLLLYAALGGAFFFLPFDLIQVHGYSATIAGAAFMPFTIIMGALSRWSGGLIDRFGAKLPLVVGPAITALGFALLALHGAGGAYWTTFLLPIATIGLGMAVSVAPLTTAVINAVPAQRTGVASGINNAVASVAGLLAVAMFGAVALSDFNRGLDHRVATMDVSSEVRQAVEHVRGKFVIDAAPTTIPSEDRRIVETLVKESLADGIRLTMWLAAGLALASAACAAFTIDGARPRQGARSRGVDHF